MENSLENTTVECLFYGRYFGATGACLCVCVCPVLTLNQLKNPNQTYLFIYLFILPTSALYNNTLKINTYNG